MVQTRISDMLAALGVAAAAWAMPLRAPPGRIESPSWAMTPRTAWLHPGLTEGTCLRSSVIAMRSGDPARSYAVLGVKPGATAAELKAAFRERAKKLHPDVNPTKAAAEEFRLLTEVSALAPLPCLAPDLVQPRCTSQLLTAAHSHHACRHSSS